MGDGQWEPVFSCSWDEKSRKEREKEQWIRKQEKLKRFVYTPVQAMPSNYIAIDFETADSSRESPCAIGVAIVENGTIKESFGRLIKPHKDHSYFDDFNINIHGITPEMVEHEPEFNEVMQGIFPLFENRHVIAHNMSFDGSVLTRTANLYGLHAPTRPTLCTVSLSRIVWPDLISYDLWNVCNKLAIDLSHHEAESDAIAAAKIVLTAENEMRQNKEAQERLINTGYSFGYIDRDLAYSPRYMRSGWGYKPLTAEEIGSDAWKDAVASTPPLSGEKFVFTGALKSMTRDQAHGIVKMAGGTHSGSVSKKTSYLVMGLQDFSRFTDGQKSSKTREVESLKASGVNIEIISEDDFLSLIDWGDE